MVAEFAIAQRRGSGTWDAFLEASHSLITPTVYNALLYAQPPEGIRHYRFPISIWKHFEGCLACPVACCRSPTRSAASTRSTARACRQLESRPFCCRMRMSRTITVPDPSQNSRNLHDRPPAFF
jgi:hypothetical protein